MPSADPATAGSKLLSLPAEIREHIFKYVLGGLHIKKDLEDGYSTYPFDFRLLRVNKQVYTEARAAFWRTNIFVAIETRWPEAETHVRDLGQVPVVISARNNNEAGGFENVHMVVTIELPEFASHGQNVEKHRFVVLVQDLPKFCEMWKYQELSNPGMSSYLSLVLKLRHPSGSTDDLHIPKAVQRKLLEPFGLVHGLRDVSVVGDHYSSVEKTMREKMAEPPATAESLLEESTKLKDAGNVAFKKNEYRVALGKYLESFHAMHIVCHGHFRQVWADGWFSKKLEGGQYDGQAGLIVRLLLRVKLVANVVWCHLKLEDFEMAKFWGVRTIEVMRESAGGEDYFPGFVAAEPMGKIYYRTALACRALSQNTALDRDTLNDLEQQTKTFVRAATKYLPNNAEVRKLFSEVTPRIG